MTVEYPCSLGDLSPVDESFGEVNRSRGKRRSSVPNNSRDCKFWDLMADAEVQNLPETSEDNGSLLKYGIQRVDCHQ